MLTVPLHSPQAASAQALVVFDYFCTLSEEVRLMWPAPWSVPKVLFFGLRYYIVVHLVFSDMYGFVPNQSPEQCAKAMFRIAISVFSILAVSEAILFIRVYAFSGKNRKLMIFLICHFLILHASALVLTLRFHKSLKFAALPPPFSETCMPVEGNTDLLSGSFGLILTSLATVMFIMMFIAVRKHRDLNSSLLRVFYRDGIFYFVVLSALATAVIAGPSGPLKFTLVLPAVSFHVILSTRMLMHLRSWAVKTCYSNDTGPGKMDIFECSGPNYGTEHLSTIQFVERRSHHMDGVVEASSAVVSVAGRGRIG